MSRERRIERKRKLAVEEDTSKRFKRKRDSETLIEKEECSKETKEYTKKPLEPRGTLGGSVAFHNGLQPAQ